jgi:hypothetical protein
MSFYDFFNNFIPVMLTANPDTRNANIGSCPVFGKFSLVVDASTCDEVEVDDGVGAGVDMDVFVGIVVDGAGSSVAAVVASVVVVVVGVVVVGVVVVGVVVGVVGFAGFGAVGVGAVGVVEVDVDGSVYTPLFKPSIMEESTLFAFTVAPVNVSTFCTKLTGLYKSKMVSSCLPSRYFKAC